MLAVNLKYSYNNDAHFAPSILAVCGKILIKLIIDNSKQLTENTILIILFPKMKRGKDVGLKRSKSRRWSRFLW